jgi:hypothetical protein
MTANGSQPGQRSKLSAINVLLLFCIAIGAVIFAFSGLMAWRVGDHLGAIDCLLLVLFIVASISLKLWRPARYGVLHNVAASLLFIFLGTSYRFHKKSMTFTEIFLLCCGIFLLGSTALGIWRGKRLQKSIENLPTETANQFRERP